MAKFILYSFSRRKFKLSSFRDALFLSYEGKPFLCGRLSWFSDQFGLGGSSDRERGFFDADEKGFNEKIIICLFWCARVEERRAGVFRLFWFVLSLIPNEIGHFAESLVFGITPCLVEPVNDEIKFSGKVARMVHEKLGGLNVVF